LLSFTFVRFLPDTFITYILDHLIFVISFLLKLRFLLVNVDN